MCSRYFLDADGNVIAHAFQVPVHDRIRKRFNIAPTQEAPVIRHSETGRREVVMMRWGLVPFWARDLAIGNKLINARSETIARKPAFRCAFKTRRCVIPASGFFEWTGGPKQRVPHAVTIEGRPLVPFAGLWDSWKDPSGRPLETYTIITTPGNRFMAALHDRMPAILGQGEIDAWMSGAPEEAWKLIRPYADEPMREREVTRALNSSTFESDDALALAGQSGQKSLF